MTSRMKARAAMMLGGIMPFLLGATTSRLALGQQLPPEQRTKRHKHQVKRSRNWWRDNNIYTGAFLRQLAAEHGVSNWEKAKRRMARTTISRRKLRKLAR